MILLKCCTQYASKFGKLSSGHRTGKGPFSFQSQRKAMPKNAQTTPQLHSSHTLVMLKILQARLQQYVNCELLDVQAGFRKGRGTRDQIANARGDLPGGRAMWRAPPRCQRRGSRRTREWTTRVRRWTLDPKKFEKYIRFQQLRIIFNS